MDFGVHLPLIDFDGSGYSLEALQEYTTAARDLGYTAVAANDHMLFARPWLDGPTALSAVLAQTGEMTLMTSVALPVIRGPVQTAKTLGAIDLLSGGRLTVAVAPGSSRADYAAVGLDFEERWKRIDEAVVALRALWRGEDREGAFYKVDGIRLEPRPRLAGAPLIWLGSWGSLAGLRRTARLADGWLASAYNTTPDDFATARESLGTHLVAAGKNPSTFPNALSTMWTYITESSSDADRVIEGVLQPMLNRPAEELASKLTVGTPEHCADILRRYRDAGVQRVLLWPVDDAVQQLRVFKERVEPLI